MTMLTFDDDDVLRYTHASRHIEIPAKEIQAITARRGPSVRHPVLMGILAVALISPLLLLTDAGRDSWWYPFAASSLSPAVICGPLFGVYLLWLIVRIKRIVWLDIAYRGRSVSLPVEGLRIQAVERTIERVHARRSAGDVAAQGVVHGARRKS